ncbi:MAG TPA: TRAP transporter small permease [Geminicoccaceae bacterium]|nr:TRAP transporter small permease [Geminicoccaceae bacterium]
MRILDLVRAFIRFWAWGVGGGLLVAVVLMTAYSVIGNFFFGRPLPGDFEIVQMGVAVAAFSFLPLAQLSRANVVVDIFTQRASTRVRRALDFLGTVAAAAFSAFLFWRMSEGMIDYYSYSEYTAILGIPHWIAFPPMLFSLLLLFVAALITAAEQLRLVPETPPARQPTGAE